MRKTIWKHLIRIWRNPQQCPSLRIQHRLGPGVRRVEQRIHQGIGGLLRSDLYATRVVQAALVDSEDDSIRREVGGRR